MFVLCTFLFILAFGFYFYHNRNHNYWSRNGVVNAKDSHWFFGHFKKVLQSTQHFGVMLQDMYNEHPNVPYVGYLKINSPGLLLRDPDVIKAVLTTDFSSFAKNEISIDKSDVLIGHNPFALHGEEWKTSRGHATPLSTLAKLKTYFPNIVDVGNVMVEYIKDQIGNKLSVSLEAKELSGKYTTDVVANAFLGVSNNTFANPDSLFASMTREIFAGGFIENSKFLIAIVFPKLSPWLRLRFSSKRTEKLLMSLTGKIMRERIETGNSRNDIFQQMIMYRNNDTSGVITDEYIASHCFSFISDGYETSSDVICFTLFELAWNCEVQERLRQEIKAMVVNTNNEYTVEDVENLVYLDMVISESVRLHPPAMAMLKLTTQDYTFHKDEKSLKIEKDISVAIPIYALHMDATYYPNPQKFDPERFTEENNAIRHKYVYLPFGEGPRKCLGKRPGLLQIKVAIVKILDNFRLQPSTKSAYPLEIDPLVMLKRPLNGAWVNFESLSK